jgi:hypothetical protein
MSVISNYLGNLGSLCVGLEPSRPLLFSYYLTHRCDLNCAYCSDGDARRFKEECIGYLKRENCLVSVVVPARRLAPI